MHISKSYKPAEHNTKVGTQCKLIYKSWLEICSCDLAVVCVLPELYGQKWPQDIASAECMSIAKDVTLFGPLGYPVNEKTQQQQKQNKNYCMSLWPGRECIFSSTVKQIAGPPDLNVYLHAYSRHKPHGQSEWSWESNLFLFNHSTAIPCANNCVISKSSEDPSKIINSSGPEVRFYIESNQSPRSEVNRQVYVWLNVGCISQMRIMYSFHYIVILNNTRVDWHCRYSNYICMIYWHVIKKCVVTTCPNRINIMWH